MKHFAEKFLQRVAVILEFFIALMLSVGIILLCLRMAGSLIYIPDLQVWPNYDDLLETCFNLIIGVELIRMMYYHTPNTVFEVLLFAIARQVIIDHSSIMGSLIGVCAIAVLFATRKFLFCEFDIAEEIIFRASTKAHEKGETLLDVLSKKCEEYDIEIGVGASVYFPDFGLRVAKMHDKKVSRIQVIHAIH